MPKGVCTLTDGKAEDVLWRRQCKAELPCIVTDNLQKHTRDRTQRDERWSTGHLLRADTERLRDTSGDLPSVPGYLFVY